MATYNTLKRGSTGADVKKLQQSLIDKGYDLGKTGADGKYGTITEAAVKQYQKDNKLTVDGMAGKQTQGTLYTVPKATTNTANTTTGAKQNTVLKANDPAEKGTLSQVTGAAQNAVSGGATKAVEAAKGANQTHEADPLPAPAQPAPAAYDPATDAAYQSALSTLLQVQQSAPTYKDSFSTQLQDAYNKIVNREKFSYDVNSDAMYQQMKDQYAAGGKLAMADTMGQAAALNGGYGSSYVQSVGQQAYQGYMQQLNDVIPELYDRALAQYNQEGQDMLTQYAMLSDMADDEYAKYQSELNDYYTRLSMAKSDVDTAYNRGYVAYRDGVDDGRAAKAEAYNKVLGFIGTDYKPSDSELSNAGLTREQYDAMSKYAAASGSGAGREHVASMSSEDIVNVLEGLKSENGEFDDAITAFLSDCVATNRMTPDQAKELYRLYGSLAVEEPEGSQNTEGWMPSLFYNIIDKPFSQFKTAIEKLKE